MLKPLVDHPAHDTSTVHVPANEKQGNSCNVSRPLARILMEANIGHLPTKFGYNQMQGW